MHFFPVHDCPSIKFKKKKTKRMIPRQDQDILPKYPGIYVILMSLCCSGELLLSCRCLPYTTMSLAMRSTACTLISTWRNYLIYSIYTSFEKDTLILQLLSHAIIGFGMLLRHTVCSFLMTIDRMPASPT